MEIRVYLMRTNGPTGQKDPSCGLFNMSTQLYSLLIQRIMRATWIGTKTTRTNRDFQNKNLICSLVMSAKNRTSGVNDLICSNTEEKSSLIVSCFAELSVKRS